jgi:hypothetical protein
MLTKQFDFVDSAQGFDDCVLQRGMRPHVENRWPGSIKNVMVDCWSASPSERPSTMHVN